MANTRWDERVWAQSRARYTPKLALLHLARLADGDGIVRGATIASIAEMLGVSPKHARSSIQHLEQLGEIEARRTLGGNGNANVYRLLVGGPRCEVAAP